MKLGLAGMVCGLLFGFVLAWAGVADDVTVQAMLRFREPHLYLMLGSTVVVAGGLARLLRAFKARSLIDGTVVHWEGSKTNRNHVIGSLLFGFGWGLAGTCPGPIAVQIGEGKAMALFTMAGLFTGVALRERRAAREAAPAQIPESAVGQ